MTNSTLEREEAESKLEEAKSARQVASKLFGALAIGAAVIPAGFALCVAVLLGAFDHGIALSLAGGFVALLVFVFLEFYGFFLSVAGRAFQEIDSKVSELSKGAVYRGPELVK